MKIDDINILQEKAKTRKDGVYTHKDIIYIVKGSKFIAYADNFGECFLRMGIFNVPIGKVVRYDRKRMLTDYLKNIK
jgi:hypothetical protein